MEDDEIEICSCPNCGRDYDEIDADYLICSRCGWDAEKKAYRKTNGKRDISRYGIDPDVKLDDWEP